jgi:predicted Zn-dependent protease
MRRILLAVPAIIVAAWFALGIRQAHDLAAATALVDSVKHLTAADARRANALLDSAGQLNPDRQVQIMRARVVLDTGDRELAERILAPVVRSEPQNADAWFWVAQAAPNPAEFFNALRHVGQLIAKIR